MVADPRTQPNELSTDHPEFNEALRIWGYIGLNSFGGPAGQIAVMHRVLVDEKRWISEERFLHALNYCMLLPGPEAQQLAVYVGWLLHGVRGGLSAGLLFVWPGALAILLLSYLYAGYQQVGLVQAIFFGLKAAVLAIVAEAVLRIGRRALKSQFQVGLAAAAFAAIYFFNVPFPLIVLGAALIGLLRAKTMGDTPSAPANKEPCVTADAVLENHGAVATAPALRRTLKVGAIWLSLWLAPVAMLFVFAGSDSVYFKVSAFFSQAATVTFGGAYSVLAYIAQEAVNTHGWLQPGEMLDGLAMAETTPGPLIMVVQFVGFMAAFREPGALNPMFAGTLAALLTTWVTFAPCFLWIFLGAPYIEALRGNKALNAALSAITAAVVGVILNLAVWFALHAIFATVHEVHGFGGRLFVPEWNTINWAAAVLAVGALVATFRFQVGMVKVLAACALGGVLMSLA
jgi:chromate transporter